MTADDRLENLERHLSEVLAGPRRLMRSLSKTTIGNNAVTDPIQDFSGTVCPHCHSGEYLSYTPIPESRRVWVDSNGTEVTEHFGELRDYRCRNCDTEFTMGEAP